MGTTYNTRATARAINLSPIWCDLHNEARR